MCKEFYLLDWTLGFAKFSWSGKITENTPKTVLPLVTTKGKTCPCKILCNKIHWHAFKIILDWQK